MIKLIQSLLNYFRGNTPRNPNEFVKKFIKDANQDRAQLEMIYKNDIILQVDPLKFVPSWFKITNKSEQEYRNGYVIFFAKGKSDFYSSNLENKFEFNKKNGVLKIEELHGNDPIVTVAKFIPETKDYLSLAIEMKNFIDEFYSFKEKNPSILFNIRYLNDIKG